MDTPTFHRADTNRVILIVHEGAEPTGDAQAEFLRLFMDPAERRHVESVSACSPAGREILRLVERERKLRVAAQRLIDAEDQFCKDTGCKADDPVGDAVEALRALLEEEA